MKKSYRVFAILGILFLVMSMFLPIVLGGGGGQPVEVQDSDGGAMTTADTINDGFYTLYNSNEDNGSLMLVNGMGATFDEGGLTTNFNLSGITIYSEGDVTTIQNFIFNLKEYYNPVKNGTFYITGLNFSGSSVINDYCGRLYSGFYSDFGNYTLNGYSHAELTGDFDVIQLPIRLDVNDTLSAKISDYSDSENYVNISMKLRRNFGESDENLTYNLNLTEYENTEFSYLNNSNYNFALENLEISQDYSIFIDGSYSETIATDSSGTLNFTYDGGMSEHDFKISFGSYSESESPLSYNEKTENRYGIGLISLIIIGLLVVSIIGMYTSVTKETISLKGFLEWLIFFIVLLVCISVMLML